jgi:hypothetical protein
MKPSKKLYFLVRVTLVCLLYFLVTQKGFPQSKSLLELFEGREITTVINSSGITGVGDEHNQSKSGGILTTVSKTTKQDRRVREVIVMANGRRGWKVTLEALKIEVLIDSDGRKSSYDSDNVFERDPMADAVSRRYDPLVRKPVRLEYTTQGKISKGDVNKAFDEFWKGHIPIFFTPELWQSWVLFPELQKVNPAPNTSWKDHGSTAQISYAIEYTITTIENDRVTVHFKGTSTPLKGANSGSAPQAAGEKGDQYEGDLIVDKNNFLILAAHYTSISELAIGTRGGIVSVISKQEYSVENTLSDLSKK